MPKPLTRLIALLAIVTVSSYCCGARWTTFSRAEAAQRDAACDALVSKLRSATGSDPVEPAAAGPYVLLSDAVLGQIGVSCPPMATVDVEWSRGPPTPDVYRAAASWGAALADASAASIEALMRAACRASTARPIEARTARRTDIGYEVACTVNVKASSWHIEVTRFGDTY